MQQVFQAEVLEEQAEYISRQCCKVWSLQLTIRLTQRRSH